MPSAPLAICGWPPSPKTADKERVAHHCSFRNPFTATLWQMFTGSAWSKTLSLFSDGPVAFQNATVGKCVWSQLAQTRFRLNLDCGLSCACREKGREGGVLGRQPSTWFIEQSRWFRYDRTTHLLNSSFSSSSRWRLSGWMALENKAGVANWALLSHFAAGTRKQPH